MLKSFLRERDGAIAVMAALLMIPMVMLVFGAIDYTRLLTQQAKLRGVAEGAALAAAALNNSRSDNSQGAREVAEEFVVASVSSDPTLSDLLLDGQGGVKQNVMDVQLTQTAETKQVSVSISAPMDLLFGQLLGATTLDINGVGIARQGNSKIEIALALDVSSSMGELTADGRTRLEALQDAADEFVEIIMNKVGSNNTSISIVPFGGSVNLGPSLFNSYAASPTPALTNVDDSAPSPVDRYGRNTNNLTDGSGIPFIDIWDVGYRFEYNNMGTPADPSDDWIDGGYCIEYQRGVDFDELPLGGGPRSQVPHFWHLYNNQPWCPGDGSMALFRSNNETALRDRIASFVMSDGTAMDIGAMWALKALSPLVPMPGTVPPDAFDPAGDTTDTLKVMIVMTDGILTGQVRPLNPYLRTTRVAPTGVTQPVNNDPNGNNPPDDPKHYPTYGFFQDGGGPSNAGNPYDGHPWYVEFSSNGENLGNIDNYIGGNGSVGHFATVCDIAEQQGVRVYTIGFEITAGEVSDQLLSYCASNGGSYYLINDIDIGTAFNTIAAEIGNLSIIG